MSKDELIVKQQLEIEELKVRLAEHIEAVYDALGCLNHPEQWSMSCPDFPQVAMTGIVGARRAIEDI